MRVFMIGGTGLLGSEAARVLLSRGHEVISLALPPLPEGSNLPPGMDLRLGDYTAMADDALRGLMQDFGLPTAIPAGLEPDALLAHMRLDKKNIAGRLRLVLWRGIGRAEVVSDVDEAAVLAVLGEG